MSTTEAEMREQEVPWPKTIEELTSYIQGLVDQKHDYGTCAYAMSMAAVAAFYYVSHQVGATGFQASFAGLDVLRRIRHMECPFMIITAEEELYPQYDNQAKLRECQEKWSEWVAERASEKLRDVATAHPDVISHWEKLVAKQKKKQASQYPF